MRQPQLSLHPQSQPDPQQPAQPPVTAPAVPESSVPTEPPPPQTVRVVHPDFSRLPNLRKMDTTLGTQSRQIMSLAGAIDKITARLNQSSNAGSVRSQDHSLQPRLPTAPSAARPPGLPGPSERSRVPLEPRTPHDRSIHVAGPPDAY